MGDGGLPTGVIFLPLWTRLKKLAAASVQLKINWFSGRRLGIAVVSPAALSHLPIQSHRAGEPRQQSLPAPLR